MSLKIGQWRHIGEFKGMDDVYERRGYTNDTPPKEVTFIYARKPGMEWFSWNGKDWEWCNTHTSTVIEADRNKALEQGRMVSK